jgi:hypothetical protein
MSGLTADINGPISRSLWNRLRRRPRYLGATATAAAVTVLLATEPNLSGIWVTAEGDIWELYHVGGSVKADLMDGTPIFVSKFVDGGGLDGSINLVWEEPMTMIPVCGGEYNEVFGASDFVARIHPDFNTIHITAMGSTHSDSDCSYRRPTRVSARLTRRED